MTSSEDAGRGVCGASLKAYGRVVLVCDRAEHEGAHHYVMPEDIRQLRRERGMEP